MLIDLHKYNYKLRLQLLTNITNINEISSKAFSNKYDIALLNAKVVPEIFPVTLAAQKAVVDNNFGQLKTRSLATELLYNLSPSKNITESLKLFGTSRDVSSLLLVAFVTDENFDAVDILVKDISEENQAQIEQLSSYSDLSYVKRVYNIKDDELTVSSLGDSISTRIAIKDL